MGELRVQDVDCVNGETFIVYFSDGTMVRITAQELAELFPDRISVPNKAEADALEAGDDPEG